MRHRLSRYMETEPVGYDMGAEAGLDPLTRAFSLCVMSATSHFCSTLQLMVLTTGAAPVTCEVSARRSTA